MAMKKLLMITVCSGLMFACSPKSEETNAQTQTPNATQSQDSVQNENERLDQWLEAVFEARVNKYPQFLTALGRKKDNDKWNDYSKTAYLEGVDRTRRDYEEMKNSFDFDKLDEEHQLSYRMFVYNALSDLDGAKWHDHTYTFTQMRGTHSALVSTLINQHRIDNVDDAKAYISRLYGMSGVFDQEIENAQRREKLGVLPPKFVYDYVISDARNIITGEPFDDGDLSTLLADFKGKVDKLGLSEDEKSELYEEAIKALITGVKPAYEVLIKEMEAQKAKANTDDGAWKLPDGNDYYKYRLERMTTTKMTADEIHKLGLSEVDRIHGEMKTIMDTVGYEGSLQEFFEYLRVDPKFIYEESDAGREAYLTEAENMINVMKGHLDDVFLTKPKADLVVKAVEPYRAKSAGKAFYNRPAADGSRPGIYYANLYRMSDMPKYQMEALAYHEGIPGHHMQLSLQQEKTGLPKFRKFSGVTAYSEGWGLYSEYLPKEMGFYEDPYSDFGRLAMELWRAARLVVDTGIHEKKWTREQAISYLTENTPNPEGDCIKAIERYIVMPGQATAYKIGMNKILEMRETAKQQLGDKFDIRQFHDVFLSSGPVPLAIFEERVGDWVKETKG